MPGERAVPWVSAEGVGVAAAIPTLGDLRASGHSIIGLALFDSSALRADAIGPLLVARPLARLAGGLRVPLNLAEKAKYGADNLDRTLLIDTRSRKAARGADNLDRTLLIDTRSR